MIDVRSAQHAGQVVAALGRERTELGEDDAEEAFGIFRHDFQGADRGGRLARQADRFGRERLAIPSVVAQRGEEGGQRIGDVMRLMSFAVRFRSVG